MNKNGEVQEYWDEVEEIRRSYEEEAPELEEMPGECADQWSPEAEDLAERYVVLTGPLDLSSLASHRHARTNYDRLIRDLTSDPIDQVIYQAIHNRANALVGEETD